MEPLPISKRTIIIHDNVELHLLLTQQKYSNSVIYIAKAQVPHVMSEK